MGVGVWGGGRVWWWFGGVCGVWWLGVCVVVVFVPQNLAWLHWINEEGIPCPDGAALELQDILIHVQTDWDAVATNILP